MRVSGRLVRMLVPLGLPIGLASCGFLLAVLLALSLLAEMGANERVSQRYRMKNGIEYYHFINPDGSSEYVAVMEDEDFVNRYTQHFDASGKLVRVEDHWTPRQYEPGFGFTEVVGPNPDPRGVFGGPPVDPMVEAALIRKESIEEVERLLGPRGRGDAGRGNPDEQPGTKKITPPVPAEGSSEGAAIPG